jgi:signal transduction histidine kinase/CheY-like chemotaxis protein
MHANRLEHEGDPLPTARGAHRTPEKTDHQRPGERTPLELVEEKKRIEMAEGDSLYSQKMEAIGTLAGGIAHDFNNLLMVIQGNISLLRHRLHGDSPHQALLEKIEQATRTGSQLTRKLLAYARKGKYHIEQVDLNGLVRESMSILGRTRKDVTVGIDLAAPLWKVSVDRCQMEQVLLNLIVNAFEAMPASGQLRVRTRNVSELEAQRLTGRPAQGDYVLVEVADTGVGMDPQTLERIFDPYFSTKKATRGAGLGLASVLGIVKNHGGHICVTSTKGSGSLFTVLLPATPQAVFEEGRPACARAQQTILVVDDEAIVLETVTKMLERLGYGVIPAANGTEALALFRQNRDRIDMVLLDLVMPGVSAGDILGEIKACRPEVKIILSSGYSLANLQERNQSLGSDGFIAKPYTMGELSKTVQASLAKNQGAAFPE